MKSQSKQEKVFELFNPLIKQAIKEDKLIIDERDGMTYLPHYFKTLIQSNSMLSPEGNELTFFKTCERKNNELQINSIIVDESISNIEVSKEKIEKFYVFIFYFLWYFYFSFFPFIKIKM